MTLPGDYFDGVYAAGPDPWGFTDRWYEERKRAVTLAALPDRALLVNVARGKVVDTEALLAELTSERPTSSQPSSVGCSQASADSSMTAASAPVASSTSTSSIVTLSSMSGAAATIDSPIGCDWVVTARS